MLLSTKCWELHPTGKCRIVFRGQLICRPDPSHPSILAELPPSLWLARQDEMTTGTDPSDYKRWIYYEWNRHLAEYFLAARTPEERQLPLERIAATPEELARVAGVDAVNASVVLDTFISCVRRELKPGQGFCDYCLGYEWDPEEFPPFFAMLWFTCLVAYGYPDGDGSYGERLGRALGKSENFNTPGLDSSCLPGLWERVAVWTEKAGADIRRLSLPLNVGRRTVIGYSHFLAFPNRFDRARLAALLHELDLVGAEPPLRLLLDALLGRRRMFSREFQEDLDDFASEYQAAVRDPRDNAFWRAIRQEAAAPSIAAEGDGPSHTSILFVVDDDALVPMLACEISFEAPNGYFVEPFDDGLSGLRLVGPNDDRELAAREAFATAKFLGNRDRRFLKSGVIPLRENNSGLLVPSSGEEVQGCRTALVRDAIASDFSRHFGGAARASIVPGWREVHGCEIVQMETLPPSLTAATLLLPTTELPSVYLIGGIRVSDGFLFAPSFLPRLRAPGVQALEVELPDRSRAVCTLDTGNAEWQLPVGVTAAGDYRILATWSVKTDQGQVARTRITDLRLRTHTITNAFKGLPSGEFFQESCSERGESALRAPDEPQFTVTTKDPGRSTDTVDFDATARLLGPGIGEMALTPREGFDWLVVGPKKEPELVVFVGDGNNPTQPRAARSASSGDRRHWHKAWQVTESRRYCRVGTANCVPWSEAPTKVRDTWLRYKRHDVDETAETCAETSLDTLNLSPLSRDVVDLRVSMVADAIAALSTERRGIGYHVLSDLFAQLLGHQDVGLIRQLIRAWTEAGLVDEVRHAVSGRTTFLARRPRFVLVRRGPDVDATLVGLVTPVTRRHFADATGRLGLPVRELSAGNPWQPTIARIRGESEQIKQLANAMHFESSIWLNWPDRSQIPDGLDAAAALRTLFTTTPPNSFRHDARWDWSESNFARGETELADGVQLSRRMNLNQLRIYVVSHEGRPVCWTYQRSWALLAAHELRATAPFIADRVTGRLKSIGHAPVHLPLPIARLCILIGEGASGPSMTGAGRSEYIYPFGRRLFALIEQVVPAGWLSR